MDPACSIAQAAFATFGKLLSEAEGARVDARAGFAAALSRLGFEFQALRTKYALATSKALLKMASRERRQEGYRDYAIAINSNNFAGQIQALGERLSAVLSAELEFENAGPRDAASARGARRGARAALRAPATRRERNLQMLAAAVQRLGGSNAPARGGAGALLARRAPHARRGEPAADDTETCPDCEVELKVNGARSEAHCPECCRIFEMHGVVYEESQFRAQEGQRSKSGCFNPNVHCQEWLMRIQALEPETEIGNADDPDDQRGEKLVRRLKAEAQTSLNKLLPLLTIEDVRTILSRVGRTDLNRNSALILKKLTGRAPPVLSEDKKLRAEMMFAAANAARTSLHSLERSNRSYYPYYIFKIIDLILDKEDPDRLLLCYIHMQSRQTLESNDEEWRQICDETGWEWRSTNVAQLIGYRTRFSKK